MSKPYGVRTRQYSTDVVFPPIYYSDGVTIRTPEHKKTLKGVQVTGSEGHPVDPKTGQRMGGGPFNTVKVTNHVGTVGYTAPSSASSKGYKYSGPVATFMVPLNSDPDLVFGSPPATEEELDIAGTNAISAVAPTNPNATLGTGLAEMFREGAPSIPGIQGWKKRLEPLKAAGSEFLNYEFGWAPLHKEVTDVSSAISHHGSLMSQYSRDSGKNVRRRFDFPIERSFSETVLNSNAFAELDGGAVFHESTGGTLTETVNTVRSRWFSGCFTYALPSTSTSWGVLQRSAEQANHLLGLNPLDPSVLWELTPWSWAFDWFSNAGEVINNLSQFGVNGLVMRYGYIMEHYSKTWTWSLSKSGLKGCPTPPPSHCSVEWKVRRPANPFGFGIGWEGLNPTQLAIAAAVGITRL